MKTKEITLILLIFLLKISLLAQPNSSYDVDFLTITGTNECAFGRGAIPGSSGQDNTAMGNNALRNNNNGNYNTADGMEALYNNYDGSYNTAMGFQSLYSNGCNGCSGGDENTAVGVSALYSNTDGNRNTAKGRYALYSNIAGSENTATGFEALYYNTSTLVGTGGENTATGHRAMKFNEIGSKNTASGKDALRDNTEGNGNTAIGFSALLSNSSTGGSTASYNTAVGHLALSANISGSYNSAIGTSALFNNLSADYNTADGVESLYSNTIGYQNTAMGYQAAYTNDDGVGLVAMGAGALAIGTDNTQNTAIGAGALNNNSANANTITVIGYNALQNNNLSVDVQVLGANADIAGIGTRSNCSAIGANAVVITTNKIRFGDTFFSMRVETQVAVSVPSDARYKYNVSSEDVKGLEFIERLRPVVYNFDNKKFTEFLVKDMPEKNRKKYTDRDFSASKNKRITGFIAQEVEKAAFDVNYDFNGIIKPKNEGDYYTIGYSIFVVPLVKAVQEQQSLIETGQKELDKMSNDLGAQNQILQEILKEKKNMSGFALSNAVLGEFTMEAQPNPFSHETVIQYYMPSVFENAAIVIKDLSGKEILTVPVVDQGKAALVISAEKLSPGMYIYSMVADGKVLNSKRMIVTGK